MKKFISICLASVLGVTTLVGSSNALFCRDTAIKITATENSINQENDSTFVNLNPIENDKQTNTATTTNEIENTAMLNNNVNNANNCIDGNCTNYNANAYNSVYGNINNSNGYYNGIYNGYNNNVYGTYNGNQAVNEGIVNPRSNVNTYKAPLTTPNYTNVNTYKNNTKSTQSNILNNNTSTSNNNNSNSNINNNNQGSISKTSTINSSENTKSNNNNENKTTSNTANSSTHINNSTNNISNSLDKQTNQQSTTNTNTNTNTKKEIMNEQQLRNDNVGLPDVKRLTSQKSQQILNSNTSDNTNDNISTFINLNNGNQLAYIALKVKEIATDDDSNNSIREISLTLSNIANDSIDMLNNDNIKTTNLTENQKNQLSTYADSLLNITQQLYTLNRNELAPYGFFLETNFSSNNFARMYNTLNQRMLLMQEASNILESINEVLTNSNSTLNETNNENVAENKKSNNETNTKNVLNQATTTKTQSTQNDNLNNNTITTNNNTKDILNTKTQSTTNSNATNNTSSSDLGNSSRIKTMSLVQDDIPYSNPNDITNSEINAKQPTLIKKIKNEKADSNKRPISKPFPKNDEMKIKNSNFPNTNPTLTR